MQPNRTLTLESADMMNLLNMGAYELDMPGRYVMFREVLNHFEGDAGARRKILSIMSKTGNKDVLQAVWEYVSLHQEKSNLIQSLDPSHFAEDIGEQLKDGFITEQNIKRVKGDIENKQWPDAPVEQIGKTLDNILNLNKTLNHYGG